MSGRAVGADYQTAVGRIVIGVLVVVAVWLACSFAAFAFGQFVVWAFPASWNVSATYARGWATGALYVGVLVPLIMRQFGKGGAA